jgi:hypothetical protein
MKYKAGMHLTRKKGGNFIPSTYNECGGKEPQKGMKLNFKKHNLSPQARLRISYLPSHVILTPINRKEV